MRVSGNNWKGLTVSFVRRSKNAKQKPDLDRKTVELRNENWSAGGSVFCVYCGQMKTSFSALVKHMNINHKVDCKHCHARFVDQSDLKKHSVIHEPNLSNEEGAHLSGKPTKEANLKMQVDATIVPPNTFEEPEMIDDDFSWPFDDGSQDLKYNTTTKENRTETSSINNAENSLITCEKCGKTSKNNKSHKAHVSRYHIKCNRPVRMEDRKRANLIDYPVIQQGKVVTDTGVTYKCDFCEKIITTTEVYLRHVRSHTGENPYKCMLCEREFPVKSALSKHSCPAVEPVKRFTCEVCGTQFKKREFMKKHMRIHTGEEAFSCEYCGKKFKFRDSLYYHLRIHRDIRLFQCETCGHRCLTRGHLNAHVRTHTGEKPFTCDTCGKGFRVRTSLRNHIQVHHIGARIHACELCPRSYHVRSHLLRHMKTHATQAQDETLDY